MCAALAARRGDETRRVLMFASLVTVSVEEKITDASRSVRIWSPDEARSNSSPFYRNRRNIL